MMYMIKVNIVLIITIISDSATSGKVGGLLCDESDAGETGSTGNVTFK